jgi:hypothetical protein
MIFFKIFNFQIFFFFKDYIFFFFICNSVLNKNGFLKFISFFIILKLKNYNFKFKLIDLCTRKFIYDDYYFVIILLYLLLTIES